MKCSLCNFESDDIFELEEHILKNHHLTFQEYVELETFNKSPYCFRCNEKRYPLTTVIKDYYYLPCRYCFDNSRKSEKVEIIDNIYKYIKSYFDYLLGDRYLQLYLVDNIYPKKTSTHDYSEFKKVLGLIELPSRDEIWFLDWVVGFPKIISQDNLDGIKIINLTKSYNIINERDTIIINDYEILFPESISYNKKHFGERYNILNPNSSRKTKGIRLDTGNCIKFFNTIDNNKSIFKIVNRITKDPIDISKIDYQDYTVIKLVLMRNKNYMRLLFSIILKLIKGSNKFNDEIFLRNTLSSFESDKVININLSWTLNKISNYINISIL